MKRMRTFFTYALMIILFYFFSNFAADMMIRNSYQDVSKENIKMEQANNGFEINIDRADSNRRQAYFTGTVKNNSNKVIEKQYVKVDSYYKGKLMQEKYLAFENMQPGEERKFKLLYSVGQIDEYRVSYVDEIPVNRTLVDKGIDKVKEFFEKIKKVNIPGVKGIGNTLKDNFEPVHVEGSNLELFIAVMWIWYALPSGAIWFII